MTASPDLQRLVRKNWPLCLPFAGAALGLLLTFVIPKRFAATAIFSPAEQGVPELPASVAALASQFGFPSAGSGYSVYYFSQVAQSREVLRAIVSDSLQSDSGTYYPVQTELDVDSDDNPADRIEAGIKEMESRIAVRVSDEAELVTLRVLGSSPAVAEQLCRSALAALDSVTATSIRRSGSAERRFATAQAERAQHALSSAERELEQFYSTNRSISSSPALQLREAVLRRQVSLRQELYLGLANQAAAAELREVRNTPSINVVQPPQATVKKYSPRKSVWMLFGLFLGAFATVAIQLSLFAPIRQFVTDTLAGADRARVG